MCDKDKYMSRDRKIDQIGSLKVLKSKLEQKIIFSNKSHSYNELRSEIENLN